MFRYIVINDNLIKVKPDVSRELYLAVFKITQKLASL